MQVDSHDLAVHIFVRDLFTEHTHTHFQSQIVQNILFPIAMFIQYTAFICIL